MRLKIMTKLSLKHKKYLAIALFIILFLFTRLPRLGTDIINPDAVNWHSRSEQFVNGLKFKQWDRTYQHYHPGVTLMWITGPTEEILRQLSPEDRVYTSTNYELFHAATKYALVFVQLILTLILIYSLSQIVGLKNSFLVAASFTFEPFFIGNSRLLHLDVLLTLFMLLGITFSYLNLKKFNWITGAFAGVFLGLAFLTKSIAIGAILFALGTGIVQQLWNKENKKALLYAISLFVPLVVTVFVVFPALWVDPVYYLTEIFSEGERVGIRKGHGQIFFGVESRNPGALFYPTILLMKMSPFMILGVILYLASLLKISAVNASKLERLKAPVLNFVDSTKNYLMRIVLKKESISFVAYLSIFYLTYLLVMTFPTKKIDRYMIPMYPYFSLLAVLGYCSLENYLQKNNYRILLLVFALLTIVLPFFTFFPYPFTYASPIFGSAQNAHEIIAQKPFGVGVHELKEFILENYGEVRVGLIDAKPLTTIYGGSKVFDIREEGSSHYDILILGPNEEIPEDVLEDTKFAKDKSLFINGLEYWRVFVKEE